MASCGFHLQGQSQKSFPAQLNLYVDDPLLASVVMSDLVQHQVSLDVLESVVDADATAPTLQLTRTLKHKAELILDSDGDALIWRYTL
ncbi:MAG: outer membrane lipopolysaccharide assembly protein LptE/RlpB, partial [Candidatus Paceibacteria bacterium]